MTQATPAPQPAAPQPAAQPPEGGTYQLPQRQAPTFQPGANPFLQPGAPPMPGGPPGGGRDALQQAILTALGTPSRYDADAVQQSFSRLSADIDDDYDARNRDAAVDLARRGVSDSTIAGDRYRDSNLARRTAKQGLASELLDRQAQTYGSDRSAAIADALGYGQYTRAGSQQDFDNNIRSEAFDREGDQAEFGASLQSAQFNAQQDQAYQQWLMAVLGLGG